MLNKTRKSAWRRSFMFVIAAVLVMSVLAGCGKLKKSDYSLDFKGVDKGEVVATYEGGKVTKTELDKYLAVLTFMDPNYAQLIAIPQFQEIYLQQYIANKELAKKASAETISATRDQVEEQMKQVSDYKKQNKKQFKKTLKDMNISEADIATSFMLSLSIVNHAKTMVTDEDVKAAYEELKPNFNTATVRHILIKTVDINQQTGESTELRKEEEALKLANEARTKLLENEDWDKLAKEYSEDGSKDNGGLIENADASNWVENFKLAAFEQEIDVIGEPVKTEFGYHVIKVEKRDVKALDQLDEAAMNNLKDAAMYEKLQKEMESIIEGLNIEITLPKPEPSPEDEGAKEGDKEDQNKEDAGKPADGESNEKDGAANSK